ncbi:unnamed protein product [Trichobilharzia szidati]|nr:unnamed protein product [Trichobilharzia szidati]
MRLIPSRLRIAVLIISAFALLLVWNILTVFDTSSVLSLYAQDGSEGDHSWLSSKNLDLDIPANQDNIKEKIAYQRGALETFYDTKNNFNTTVKVDIYGECGSKKCPRLSEESCFKILREKYKFYLSFENSLCKYYVTEKFYRNALQNDIIPIVMGASIEEYQALAPPHSFIHVDQFESPKELAEYLRYLDRNNTAYNEYFAWRGHGEVSNWHGEPQCEICLLAHTIQHVKPHWVSDVSVWWNDACKNRNLRWKPSIL